jgi:hypothetical protein
MTHDITCGLAHEWERPSCPGCLAAWERQYTVQRVQPEELGDWPAEAPDVSQAVRDVLLQARARYQRTPLTRRPALDCPSSVVGMLSRGEVTTLALARCWSLPRWAQRIIRTPPRVEDRTEQADDALGLLVSVAERHPDTLRELIQSVLGRGGVA